MASFWSFEFDSPCESNAPKFGGSVTDESTGHMSAAKQAALKALITHGKEAGFLIRAKAQSFLSPDLFEPAQADDVLTMIQDMGIPIFGSQPERR